MEDSNNTHIGISSGLLRGLNGTFHVKFLEQHRIIVHVPYMWLSVLSVHLSVHFRELLLYREKNLPAVFCMCPFLIPLSFRISKECRKSLCWWKCKKNKLCHAYLVPKVLSGRNEIGHFFFLTGLTSGWKIINF